MALSSVVTGILRRRFTRGKNRGVFRIEPKVQPTAIRNDARGEQQLAGTMGLPRSCSRTCRPAVQLETMTRCNHRTARRRNRWSSSGISPMYTSG